MGTAGKGVAWEAHLSSFAGTVLGASHWYVRLDGRVEDVEVAYVMDADDARALSGRDYIQEPGDWTTRFRSLDLACKAAVVAFRELAGDRDVLIEESDADQVLAGPDDLQSEGVIAARDTSGDAWWEWKRSFTPHERDTRFGRGAPPSVRRKIEIVLEHVPGDWKVGEVRRDGGS